MHTDERRTTRRKSAEVARQQINVITCEKITETYTKTNMMIIINNRNDTIGFGTTMKRNHRISFSATRIVCHNVKQA